MTLAKVNDSMTWLGSLKVGDKVILESGGVAARQWLREVEQVTSAQVVVEGVSFDRSEGQEQRTSGKYSKHRQLLEANPERVRAVQIAEARVRLTAVRWDKRSGSGGIADEVVERVWAILEAEMEIGGPVGRVRE